jgi:hypothetical protein
MQVWRESSRLNWESALKTAYLEASRGTWNSGCSGEMRRDPEEHQWRRRRPGLDLTLRRDSTGSERD